MSPRLGWAPVHCPLQGCESTPCGDGRHGRSSVGEGLWYHRLEEDHKGQGTVPVNWHQTWQELLWLMDTLLIILGSLGWRSIFFQSLMLQKLSFSATGCLDLDRSAATESRRLKCHSSLKGRSSPYLRLVTFSSGGSLFDLLFEYEQLKPAQQRSEIEFWVHVLFLRYCLLHMPLPWLDVFNIDVWLGWKQGEDRDDGKETWKCPQGGTVSCKVLSGPFSNFSSPTGLVGSDTVSFQNPSVPHLFVLVFPVIGLWIMAD